MPLVLLARAPPSEPEGVSEDVIEAVREMLQLPSPPEESSLSLDKTVTVALTPAVDDFSWASQEILSRTVDTGHCGPGKRTQGIQQPQHLQELPS